MIRVKIDKLLACYLKPLNKTGIVEPKDMKNFEIVKVCIFHNVYIIYACIHMLRQRRFEVSATSLNMPLDVHTDI